MKEYQVVLTDGQVVYINAQSPSDVLSTIEAEYGYKRHVIVSIKPLGPAIVKAKVVIKALAA